MSTASNTDVCSLYDPFFFYSWFCLGTSLVRSLEEAERKAELLQESSDRAKAALEQLKREHDEQTELCKQMEEFAKVPLFMFRKLVGSQSCKNKKGIGRC